MIDHDIDLLKSWCANQNALNEAIIEQLKDLTSLVTLQEKRIEALGTINKDELLKWLREEADEYTSTDDRATGYHHVINVVESGYFDTKREV